MAAMWIIRRARVETMQLQRRVRTRSKLSMLAPVRLFSTTVTTRPLQTNSREVAHVSFQGNKKYPLINAESIHKLVGLFQELDLNSRLTAVFLRSSFAGADLQEMASLSTRKQADSFIASVGALCHAIYSFRAPVIAVIDGPCMGAGMELAASCDMRIAAAETAKFAMPETLLVYPVISPARSAVRIANLQVQALTIEAQGIPSVVQASLIPGLIGWGRARECLYLGTAIDGQTAYNWGFVNKLVKRNGMEEAIDGFEKKLASTGLGALEAQKRVLAAWQSHDAGIKGNTVEVNQQFGACIEQGEASRLMNNFLESRKA